MKDHVARLRELEGVAARLTSVKTSATPHVTRAASQSRQKSLKRFGASGDIFLLMISANHDDISRSAHHHISGSALRRSRSAILALFGEAYRGQEDGTGLKQREPTRCGGTFRGSERAVSVLRLCLAGRWANCQF
jgi:hypothetical protein